MSDAKFLPKVIEYDRYQPEFYEDTFTYIKKRSSNQKLKKGLELYKKEKSIIKSIEKEFDVEKELLLALMGIETNFGKYLGKMDIVSSLATLSYAYAVSFSMSGFCEPTTTAPTTKAIARPIANAIKTAIGRYS